MVPPGTTSAVLAYYDLFNLLFPKQAYSCTFLFHPCHNFPNIYLSFQIRICTHLFQFNLIFPLNPLSDAAQLQP